MDTLFFWLSKLIWMVVSPDMILIFMALAGLVLLYAGKIKAAGAVFTGLVLFMGTVTVLPLGLWLYAPLENRFPVNPDLPETVDGIIMLGGAENAHKSSLWDQPEIRGAAERYLGFIRLVNQYPQAVHIFTGGSGDIARPQAKDAHVARRVLGILGVDISKIIFEEKSRNTYENGRFSKILAAPHPGQNWILVTSAAHMPRAVGVFEKLGWAVIPYPVDHYTCKGEGGLTLNFAGNLNLLSKAAREWVGLAAYYATGKTSALFPPARQ
ncbi:MAG: YdcF family protein [Desulfobacter sp.]|nr:MAG: YdcF family protein [Desulfobacter sp.]